MSSRVAVFAPFLPPARAGVTLYRLLAGVAPERYCLLAPQVSPGDTTPALPPEPHLIPPPDEDLPWPPPPGIDGLRRTRLKFSRVGERAAAMAGVLEAEGCAALAAFTGGDATYLPAAARAARQRRAPFVPVYLDDYHFQFNLLGGTYGASLRLLARAHEVLFLWRAHRVLVVSEFLAGVLRRRHGVRAVVMRVPAGAAFLEPPPPLPWPLRPKEVRIVFAGSVYEAQAGALRTLTRALARLGRADVSLHVYTEYSEESLRAQGLEGPFQRHDTVENLELRDLERRADVLFLPLSFSSPYPSIVRTSQPGKLGEYLSSGRPVLAHVPPDSFTAHYLRQHDCAVVASHDDPAALAAALDRLLQDTALRERLVARALERARTDFDPAVARRVFWDAVSPGSPPP